MYPKVLSASSKRASRQCFKRNPAATPKKVLRTLSRSLLWGESLGAFAFPMGFPVSFGVLKFPLAPWVSLGFQLGLPMGRSARGLSASAGPRPSALASTSPPEPSKISRRRFIWPMPRKCVFVWLDTWGRLLSQAIHA